jgi:acyl dehydratase
MICLIQCLWADNVFANLDWDGVRLPNPVFDGGTIFSESTVINAGESGSCS